MLINKLVIDMKLGKKFQYIVEKLDLKNNIASLEAYPE